MGSSRKLPYEISALDLSRNLLTRRRRSLLLILKGIKSLKREKWAAIRQEW